MREDHRPAGAGDGHYSLRNIRRSALHFVLGKAGSAVLTFVAFALTARLLGQRDYGIYAALLAAVELGMALCTLGLDWATGRFLPEYRSRAEAPVLRRFVAAVVAVQVLALLAAAALMAGGAGWWAAQLGLADARLLQLYAAVLLAEGSARLLRDQVLGPLLAQGAAQVATLARAVVLVGLLLAAGSVAPLGGSMLRLVAGAELLAATVSLALAAGALLLLLRRHQPDAQPAGAAPWQPPSWRRIAAMARNAYASMLLLLPAGGAVLTLALGSVAGAAAAGSFGFARGLVEQVRRFLPIELFLGLIRPGVVARYAARRDFTALNRQMGLVFAVSVVAALPVLALLAAQGPLVAALLGGAGFDAAGPVLAVWSLSLLLFTHRRAQEVVAVTAEQSQACVAGAALLALSPLALVAAVKLGASVPLALAAPLLADLGFAAIVAALLQRAGLHYRLPWRTLGKLLLLLPLAALLLQGLACSACAPAPQLAFGLLAAVAATWGAAALWRPFDSAERAAINALLPRPWFPF